MRKLAWIIGLAAVAWCAWWWAATTGMSRGVEGWLGARQAEGWQAEVSDLSSGGFPLHLRTDLHDLALADPAAGLAIQTDRLQIAAPAWWPGDATVTLADTPILLASPLGQSELTMQDGVMALNLHPGTALELEALGWTAGPWQVSDPAGVQAAATALTLTMTQTDGATYDLRADAPGFSPGDAARRAVRLPDGFPRAFDSLQATATVTFDTPWDRRALDQRRPQLRAIALHLAEAKWGDLSLNFAADLTVDASGIPDGTMSIQADNWRTMLDLAQASGLLPTQLRGQADNILQALAGASGNPDTLDVDLTVRGGAILLGFIPVASAPRLILR
ncbi:MAG: DUF2125 domain-containing protein [Pseudomonadota bacterium]